MTREPEKSPYADSLADEILEEIRRQMPFLYRATIHTPAVPIAERLPALEQIARRLCAMNGGARDWIAPAVRSYIVLSLEFLKLQRQLEQTGRYLLSSEREAQERVYNNEDVFGGYYLYGLLLSEALWPNHFTLNSHYRDHFLPSVRSDAHILEAGVGTGYHLALLLEARPACLYEGCDLSDYAIEFARRFAVAGAQKQTRTSIHKRNVMDGLPAADGTYDNIIMGEILEHVERPDRLLDETYRVLRTGGTMYMTTVVFAANIDHIYLFEHADEIRRLVTSRRWTIEKDWVLPVYPSDSPNAAKRPMNYGSVLRKPL